MLNTETTTVKVSNYYLLNIINHDTKEFHLRIEDTPGTGIHNLRHYSASATRLLDKKANGSIASTPQWIVDRYKWMYSNLKSNLEQYVVARIEATSPVEARKQGRKARQNLVKVMESLGYKKAC